MGMPTARGIIISAMWTSNATAVRQGECRRNQKSMADLQATDK